MANALLCRTAAPCGARFLCGQEHVSRPIHYQGGPLTSRVNNHKVAICHLPKTTRRRVVGRSYPGDFSNLFSGPFFKSDIIRKELETLVKENYQLSQLASKFPEFDLDGKRMYIDKVEENAERYEIFIKRLELSDDPGAKEFIRTNNAQMLEGGFSYGSLFAGLKRSLGDYRKWVAEEERLIGDPVAHGKFRTALRAQWKGSLLGVIDPSFMFEKLDLRIIAKAQSDPKFWVAMTEISTTPTPAVMAKWMDNPNIGPFVAEMWKSMQQGSK